MAARQPLTDVAIVGGGIAGLSAAWELVQRGRRPLVVERADRPGGVIRTERLDRLTIDAGPDSLLIQKPAAVDLCRELGLADRLLPTIEPRTAYVLRAGVLHALPESSILGIPAGVWPLARSRLLSPIGRARMALDLVLPAARWDAQRDESIAAFIARRFGREAVDYIAEPLLAGIHAGDADRLSIRALFPRLVDAEIRHRSLILAFRRALADRSPGGVFRSLPGGIGELVETLAAALPSGVVRLGCEAVGLERDGAWTVLLASGEPIPARTLLLATPAWAAAALLAQVDDELAALCSGIPYSSTAVVVLAYPRDRVDNPLVGSGFVVPRVERADGLLAASFVSSKWPERSPSDVVLLRAFLGGARSPDLLERTDGELVALAHGHLAGLLGVAGSPEVARVYRWNRANAQHEVGHLGRLAAIEGRLDTLPGLLLTGGGFRGVGIPDCIADGRAMARRIDEILDRTGRSA